MNTIPCPHWSDCGVKGGGCCAVGRFGGKPSAGVCRACDHPDKRPMPGLPAKLAHGTVGLAKAAAGIDKADPETIARREATCRGCEHAKVTLGIIERCRLCGCAVKAKVRIAGERCPAGKW